MRRDGVRKWYRHPTSRGGVGRPRRRFTATLLLASSLGSGASAQSGDVPGGPGHTTVGSVQLELAGTPRPDMELSLRGSYFNGSVEGGLLEPGVQFRVSRFLTVGPSYFHLFQTATADRPDRHDRRVRFSAVATAEVAGVRLKHRSLAEYRFRDGGGGWRYRPQFEIAKEFGAEGRRVTPYVADEPIYDFAQSRWTGNQVFAGVRFAVGRSVEASLSEYHLDQFRGADTDAITLGLRYSVGR